jgi:hypothetical protein
MKRFPCQKCKINKITEYNKSGLCGVCRREKYQKEHTKKQSPIRAIDFLKIK